MKLIDHLRTQSDTWPDMPVIIADEIMAQIDALAVTLNYTPPASDYGIVAPPFQKFFIEGESRGPDGELVQRGVFCEDISEDLETGEYNKPGGAPPGTRWILVMHGWLWVGRKYLYSYPSGMYFHMDEEGRLLDDMNAVNIAIETYREMRDPGYLEPTALAGHAPYALKAISAMHRRTEVEHVTPTGAAARKFRKRHKIEPSSYYVLKVKPTAPGSTSFKAVGQPVNPQRREHVVRGHFRFYHPDRPGLGGKLTGMIWIPEHDRGSSTIGQIRKDYEVE